MHNRQPKITFSPVLNEQYIVQHNQPKSNGNFVVQGMPSRDQYYLDVNNKTNLEDSYKKYINHDMYENQNNHNTTNKFEQINKLNWNIISILEHNMSGNYFVYNIGVIYFLSHLFIYSGGNTESLFQDIFTLNKMEIKGEMEILNIYLHKMQCINVKNIYYINSNKIKNITNKNTFIEHNIMNTDKPVHASNNVNLQMRNIYKNRINTIFDPFHLLKLQSTFLSVGIIEPIWNQSFDKIIELKKGQMITPYLYSKNKTHNYYEDEEIQLLEIEFHDNNIVMGFILNKEKNVGINYDKFNFYIENAF